MFGFGALSHALTGNSPGEISKTATVLLALDKAAVSSAVKHQRRTSAVVGFGYTTDHDYMVAAIMGGFKVAFKRGERAFDDRHPAVAEMGRDLVDRGF